MNARKLIESAVTQGPEQTTSVCQDCKQPFTYDFVWYLNPRKRCNSCALKKPYVVRRVASK